MKKLAITILVVLGLGYGAWTVLYPTTRLHAKITIDVETPEGLKTGSSVQEVVFSLEPCPLCNSGSPVLRRSVRGEAVAVDLGERGVLFALLRGLNSPDPIAPHVIMTALAKLKTNEEWATAEVVRRLRHVSGRANVPTDLMFFLVRFRDINDPNTVEQVIPNGLAASFGEGVKLTKATIEIVSSGLWPFSAFGLSGTPTTTGIEKRLVWLSALRARGGTLDGSRVSKSNELSNSLGGGAFKW